MLLHFTVVCSCVCTPCYVPSHLTRGMRLLLLTRLKRLWRASYSMSLTSAFSCSTFFLSMSSSFSRRSIRALWCSRRAGGNSGENTALQMGIHRWMCRNGSVYRWTNANEQAHQMHTHRNTPPRKYYRSPVSVRIPTVPRNKYILKKCILSAGGSE